MKFYNRLGKTAPETVKLNEKTCKNKCFGKSAIFSCHSDLKKKTEELAKDVSKTA